MVIYQYISFSLLHTLFTTKKNEIRLIFPNYLAMFPRSPQLRAFQKKPHNISAQPMALLFSPRATRKTACTGNVLGGQGGRHRSRNVALVPLLYQPQLGQELIHEQERGFDRGMGSKHSSASNPMSFWD